MQGDATTGDLQYSVVGTAPNRTLVVQWTNYDDYESALNGDSWSFQMFVRNMESNFCSLWNDDF